MQIREQFITCLMLSLSFELSKKLRELNEAKPKASIFSEVYLQTILIQKGQIEFTSTKIIIQQGGMRFISIMEVWLNV